MVDSPATSERRRADTRPPAEVGSVKQLRHWEGGGSVYTFDQLKAAAARRRKGRATAEDQLQLSMIRPEQIESLLRVHDVEQEDRRQVERDVRQFGTQAAVDFYGGLGQLGYYRRLGVRFRNAPRRHEGRAHGPAPGRQRGSRRRSGSRAGPSDPDDPEPADLASESSGHIDGGAQRKTGVA